MPQQTGSPSVFQRL